MSDLPDCLEITAEPYSIGASAEHLLGYFYIQDKSSLVPALALAPVPGDTVIDMAASPGGKTTHIAQIVKNEGLIVAIEKDPLRMPGLRANLGRCGVRNTALFEMDALEVGRLDIKADKILLDAPCTGEGVIAKDQSRKTSRELADISYCASLQRELIDAASRRPQAGRHAGLLDLLLRPGGGRGGRGLRREEARHEGRADPLRVARAQVVRIAALQPGSGERETHVPARPPYHGLFRREVALCLEASRRTS